jgi:hypothetical protein
MFSLTSLGYLRYNRLSLNVPVPQRGFFSNASKQGDKDEKTLKSAVTVEVSLFEMFLFE